MVEVLGSVTEWWAAVDMTEMVQLRSGFARVGMMDTIEAKHHIVLSFFHATKTANALYASLLTICHCSIGSN